MNFYNGQSVTVLEEGVRKIGKVEEVIDAEDGLCFVVFDDGGCTWAAPGDEDYGNLQPAEPEYSI